MSDEVEVTQSRRRSVLAAVAFGLALGGVGGFFLFPNIFSESGLLAFPAAFVLAAVALVQIARSEGRLTGRALAVMAMVPFVLGTAAYIVLPRLITDEISCTSNMKRLGIALMMYQLDYEGYFPPSAKWQDAVLPYLRNENASTFRCPKARSDQPTYALNPAVKCSLESALPYPAGTVLAFDSIPGKNLAGALELLPPTPRHTGFDSILFADGHAKSHQRAEVRRLCGWTVKAVPGKEDGDEH